MKNKLILLALFWVIFNLGPLNLKGDQANQAEQKKKKPQNVVVIDRNKVDADFAIQGEYSGNLTDDGETFKAGVQVIALGNHKFRAIAYPGGLPGDGWKKQEVIVVEGKTEDGVTIMTSQAGSGIVNDGTSILVKNSAGQDMGTLKKISRKSPTLGTKPPKGAVILFDGSSPEAFKDGRVTSDKLLMEGATSLQKFQNITLHLEFMLSYIPHARKQGRSNSGCYLQGRYEVQILDSFGLEGKDNECGAIYGVRAPTVNMCYPPLTWQTFDIDFTAAIFDGNGSKTAGAKMTVRHNGVVVQKDVVVPNSTRAAPVQEGREPGPIFLQNHGNSLRFRNIWVAEKK